MLGLLLKKICHQNLSKVLIILITLRPSWKFLLVSGPTQRWFEKTSHYYWKYAWFGLWVGSIFELMSISNCHSNECNQIVISAILNDNYCQTKFKLFVTSNSGNRILADHDSSARRFICRGNFEDVLPLEKWNKSRGGIRSVSFDHKVSSKAKLLGRSLPVWPDFALWASFYSLRQQLICPNLPHS